METIAVEAITWRGLPAWRLTGRELELVVSTIGAHLAVIRLREETLNPLWQPPWPSAEPAGVGDGQGWGNGPEAPLLAGICGHNLCLDRFGAPWPGEVRPLHGEAGVVRWRLAPPERDAVTFLAELPLARLQVRRRISVTGHTVTLESAVLHDGDAPRAIEWAEHPTIGGRFLDGALFTAGVDRAWNWPGTRAAESRFANSAPLAEIPVAAALAFPAPDQAPCGDVLGARVVDGWWSAEHPGLRRRLTYRFDRTLFPWLAIWTQHRSRRSAPWLGQVRARGMEFSTKPFPEGQPPPERATRWQGTATERVLAPGRWLRTSATITWTGC